MYKKRRIERRVASLEGKVKINGREKFKIIIADNEEDSERQQAEYLKTHPAPGCFICLDTLLTEK